MRANALFLPPELLAPAGDEDSLRAAVANGANAIYFGLQDFNARRRAANFTLERLPDLVRWLHRRNVRAYVAFNTLVFSGELDRAQQYIAGIARAGADAIIVQDLGLMRLIRAMCPSLPIHASTQTTQTHPDGIAFLKTLGVSRVILARELSLAQIETIARATDVELEVFVHGAICISFSGQCLASEVLWNRSANRGLCAQACRLPYELIIDDKTAGPDDRRYPMSPRDLRAAGLLDKLVALGVAGFKIEGRLKSGAYVASATRVYREVLDSCLRGRPSKLTRDQELELTLSFSRGFTTGFLESRHPTDLVDGRFPRSRGLLVGHVDGRTRDRIVVRLTEDWTPSEIPLSPGDGVVFDEGRPDASEQGGRVYEVHPRSGRPLRVELAFGRDDLDVRSVSIGSRVWKTDDPALRRKLERSGRKEDVVHRSPLHARVEAAPGHPLRLTFRPVAAASSLCLHGQIACGTEVSVESDQPLETATRHPLTVDLLREQLGRLGDTPFELTGVELAGPEGPVQSVPAMAPKSLLNDLRRKAIELLLDARDSAAAHAIVSPAALEQLRSNLSSSCPAGSERLNWSLLVRTDDQLRAVADWLPTAQSRPSLIYLDATLAPDAETLKTLRAADSLVGLASTVVTMPGEEGFLDRLIAARPDAILVRSLTVLEYIRGRAPGLSLIGDYSLNAANELAAAVLAEARLTRVTPAYDLDVSQLAAMRLRVPGVSMELIVHAHVPMFHTAHCLLPGCASGTRTKARSERPCDSDDIRLRDRNGHSHLLMIDPACRTTVFTARVQSALGLWTEVLCSGQPASSKAGDAWMRIELLRESVDQTRELLDVYAAVFSETLSPAEALRRLGRLYPAGVTPGTLAIRAPSASEAYAE